MHTYIYIYIYYLLLLQTNLYVCCLYRAEPHLLRGLRPAPCTRARVLETQVNSKQENTQTNIQRTNTEHTNTQERKHDITSTYILIITNTT